MNMKKNKKGFTLMEMLIVVAIIAVLVAIAIPVLSNNLHRARVAADWANLRSYYAVLQADYIQTGEYEDEIGDWKYPQYLDALYDTIYYPDGETIKLQAGYYMIRINGKTGGYAIMYQCSSAHDGCTRRIG